MAEIASAFVSVMPSAKGFGRSLTGQVNGETRSAGKSIGRTFGKMFVLGASVLAAAGIGNLLKGSIDEAREAQKVGAATEAIIKATGGAAEVTADQVGKMAGRLSAVTGIDDEVIQQGSNLLLTFKNVKNFVDGEFVGTFDRATASAVDLSAAGFGSVDSAAKMLGKALNDPLKGITALSRAGVTFSDAQKEQIANFIETGDVAKAQNLILKEVESQVGGVAEATATTGEKAKVALGNLKEQVGTALLPAVDAAADAFVKLSPRISSAIEGIGPAFDRVKGFAKDAFAKVSDIADKIDFSRVIDPLVDGLKSAKTNAKKLADSIGSLDFENLDSKQLGENLGNALADALDRFISLSGTVTKTLAKMFGKVDWVGLGITIGKQVPAMLLGLVVGILNFDFEALFEGVKDHWGEILIAVLTIAFAPSKLAGPLAKILGKIPFVGKFLAASVKWLNDLGHKLLSFGEDLLKVMWRGFTGGKPLPGAGVVAKVLNALKSLPGKVKDFIVLLQTRLGVWALRAFEAIGKGARTAIGTVLRFVASVPGRILSALGSLLRLLSPRGADLMEGLLRAIRDKAGSVLQFVKGIPGRIKNQFSNAGSLLKTIGGQIIDGLVAGIKAAASKVAAAVQAIINKIPKVIRDKMGISSPSKVTTYLGRMIGDGLARGIESTAEKVSKATQKLIDKLKDRLENLKGEFKSLKDSVAGAFTGNLFEAETASGFISNLLDTKGQLTALKAAFTKLIGWGLKPEFLSQLFQSGNGGLILDLAAGTKDQATQANALFGDVTSLSNSLGANVADAKFGDRIDGVRQEIKELRKDLKNNAREIGQNVGREINGAARGGRRLARV